MRVGTLGLICLVLYNLMLALEVLKPAEKGGRQRGESMEFNKTRGR